jgi:hypothetical protein
LSIKDDIIPHIFHLNSPKEVWNILKKLYESTRTYKLFLLKSTFYKLNMQETYNMSNFPFVVKDLLGQIAKVGDIIKDEDVMLIG